MIFDEKGKPHIECESCFNNSKNNKFCPCAIFSGNPDLPNLFNIKFPEKIVKSKPKENIYEGKL